MSKPSVDIGRVGIWYGGIDALPTPEAQRAAQVVEELGFGALWVAEAVGRDPFVSAAVLLSATENLKIATGIANIYARDPMTMAAGQKTLAEAFPGRFLLGLGVSHGHLVAGIRKHDYSKPYSYMVEYLDKMDKALFMAQRPRRRRRPRPRRTRPEDARAVGHQGQRLAPVLHHPRAHRASPARPWAPTPSSPPSRWWCSRPTRPRPAASPAPA